MERKQLSWDALTPPIIEAYLLTRELSSVSVAKAMSALRKFMQFLLYYDLVEHNPMALIKRPRIRRKNPEVVSEAQIDQLLSACDITTVLGLRDRTLYELMYSCGLRISEAVDLDVKNLSQGGYYSRGW